MLKKMKGNKKLYFARCSLLIRADDVHVVLVLLMMFFLSTYGKMPTLSMTCLRVSLEKLHFMQSSGDDILYEYAVMLCAS